MEFTLIRFIIKIVRPYILLEGILVYALGVSLARFLGNPIDWGFLILGQIWVTTFQAGSHFLEAYFCHSTDPKDPRRFHIETDETQEGIRRDIALWLSLAMYAATASLTLALIQNSVLNIAGIVLMGLIFIGSIFYSVPPFQLISSGYGELVQSIIIASLIPGIGFILQTGEIHRLVAMITFPIITLHLAMSIVLQFSRFASDTRKNNNTLLVRLGWERGLIFHNLLILGSFLLMGAAMLFGLPASIAIPTYAVLPLGLFQIWYLSRIGIGAKPNWRALNTTGILTFGLTVYLLLFRLLTR